MINVKLKDLLKKYGEEIENDMYNELLEDVLGLDNVNCKDEDGWTLLMYAANDNELEIASMLLECGAEVDVTSNDDNETALIFAAYCGYSEMVDLILKYNPNPYIKGSDGLTAEGSARNMGYNKIADKIKEYALSRHNKPKCPVKDILFKILRAETKEEVNNLIEETLKTFENSSVMTDDMLKITNELVSLRNRLGFLKSKKDMLRELRDKLCSIPLELKREKNWNMDIYYVLLNRDGKFLLVNQFGVPFDKKESSIADSYLIRSGVENVVLINNEEYYVMYLNDLLCIEGDFEASYYYKVAQSIKKFLIDNPEFVDKLFENVEKTKSLKKQS